MSDRIAFIFPGQGSQSVGMGKAMAKAHEEVEQALTEADTALGERLSDLVFSGPEAELRLTRNAQPAIVAISVALARLAMKIVQPDCVAGHSLGEYSALVVAGSLSFGDAIRVARQRGLLMEAAVPLGTGTMAAILGLSAAEVSDICERARTSGTVELATLNGGGQVVIAGTVAAVKEASRLAVDAGARRVQQLNVSGPFHSSLLRGAGEELRAVLASVAVEPASIPVYCNTLAAPCRDPQALREALVKQVSSAVRWEESVTAMAAAGVRTFVEIGPGRVLSGLVRRILSDVEISNIGDPESWDKFLAWAKGNGVI